MHVFITLFEFNAMEALGDTVFITRAHYLYNTIEQVRIGYTDL
jgi:hypothetical protein